MHFSTFITATLFGLAAASPAPAPLEKRGGQQWKNYGSCPLPQRSGYAPIIVQEPSCPDPSFYGRYRSSGDQRYNKYRDYINSIPRWYAASYDVSRPNDGLVYRNNYQSPQRDDISWIQNNIVFDYGDNGRGGYDWYRGGRQQDYRLDIDQAWDMGFMDRFLNQQLGGYYKSQSRYCSDFMQKICGNDISWFRDLYGQLPGLDESRGSGYADFYGIDRMTRYAKDVIYARDWDNRDYCRLDGSLRAQQLIVIMERVNVAFQVMREKSYIDVFTRTNIRIHGQMINIDNRIKVSNNRGIVRNNWADSFKVWIRNQIELSESSAWDWYQRALVQVRVRIDEEISVNSLRGSFRDNLEQRYNRLVVKVKTDFQFSENFAVIS